MKTVLYLVRHGATDANLEKPPRLQGRRRNLPLAAVGVRQAELTRDFLAIQRIDACYCSPLDRARSTAAIIAAPHGLKPRAVEELTECDVGAWEGLSWEEIAKQFPREYQQHLSNPFRHGYPEGESFADVRERVSGALDEILRKHAGEALLVVAHHVTCRVYLAEALGLPPEMGRRVSLANCSISVLTCNDTKTEVKTLNSMFHLDGMVTG